VKQHMKNVCCVRHFLKGDRNAFHYLIVLLILMLLGAVGTLPRGLTAETGVFPQRRPWIDCGGPPHPADDGTHLIANDENTEISQQGLIEK